MKYRFEFATGQRSTEFSTTLQPGAEYANVSHQVAIPLTAAIFPQPDGGGQGGGGVGQGGQGGLAAVLPPDPDFPVDPKPKEFEIKGKGLPSNEHKNDVRLRVLSHGGGKVVSNSSGYHIVCEPKASVKPVGPITAPTKPEPAAPPSPVIVTPAPVSPPVVTEPPRLVCTGGTVRGTGARAACVCPRGQEPRQVGPNRFQCQRVVVQITCTGGTVRGNDCVCARTLQKVQTGPTAWRCVQPTPSTLRPMVTKPTTVPTRVTCQGGSVRSNTCVCPRGMQRVSAGTANAWRCVAAQPPSSIQAVPRLQVR